MCLSLATADILALVSPLNIIFSHLLLLTDAEDLHTLHPRTGHYDLLRWPDAEPDSDAQRRLWTTHGPGVRLCRSASTARDGRHRNWPPQRHLPHLWRYCNTQIH